ATRQPMGGVDKPEVSRKRKGRALRPEEIQALLANCETSETRLIVLTAILTGMRRGELFSLQWEDINWQHDVIRVRQALYWMYGKHIRPAEGELCVFIEPKTENSTREIDLSPALKTELSVRRTQRSTVTVSVSGEMVVKEPTGLVFCTASGRPM